MADITKCTNEECPQKKYCYRHTAPNSHWQSFQRYEFHESGCDNFKEIPKKSTLKEILIELSENGYFNK